MLSKNNKKPDYNYLTIVSNIISFIGFIGLISTIPMFFLIGWTAIFQAGIFSVVIGVGALIDLLIDISHHLWHLRFPNESEYKPGESLQGWKSEIQV
jgi:uncharacterized membrane protein